MSPEKRTAQANVARRQIKGVSFGVRSRAVLDFVVRAGRTTARAVHQAVGGPDDRRVGGIRAILRRLCLYGLVERERLGVTVPFLYSATEKGRRRIENPTNK